MSGSVEDPSLSSRLHQKQSQLASDAIADMTIADRLTRRALNQRIVINLGDEDDPIDVEIRIPVSAELDVLVSGKDRLEQATTPEEREAVTLELISVLADICVDESLDVDYWQSGMFSIEIMTLITNAACVDAAERVTAARDFRPPTRRAGALPTVRKTRKAST